MAIVETKNCGTDKQRDKLRDRQRDRQTDT